MRQRHDVPFTALAVALITALFIYMYLGHWQHFLFKHSLSSSETRQFINLIEKPAYMKDLLLSKIASHPDDALAWRLLANCYLKLGDEQSAAYATRKALQLASPASIPQFNHPG